MSDISYAIIAATAGSAGAELAFDTSIPDFVLAGSQSIQIALKVNKTNVAWSVQEVSGTFDGTVTIDDYGYSTAADSSLIKVATFTAGAGYTSSTTFTLTATLGDQIITSNQFTVSGTGTPIVKKLEILSNESTTTGLDNSLNNLEVVVQRGALLYSQPQGQIEFTSPGTTVWTVPDGVTQVSAVAIGGGGGAGIGGGAGGNLAYNTFTVTPGEILTVTVGAGGTGVGTQSQGQTSVSLSATPTEGESSFIDSSNGCKLFAPGGKPGSRLPETPQTGDDPNWWKAENTSSTIGRPVEFAEAQAASQTLYLGGAGGNYNPYSQFSSNAGPCEFASAGGGAAGYAGAGGEGAPFTNTLSGISGLAGRSPDVNSGGAGGGGTFRSSVLGAIFNGAGGGTGIYGLGLDGSGGSDAQNNRGGTGGSGGTTGSETGVNSGDDGVGGLYGGGGGGTGTNLLVASGNNYNINDGGDGAVRIIWGENRAYPGTNTQDVTPITQSEVDSTLGISNDTPAFKYTLVNPLNTVSLPRTITSRQFSRGQDKTTIPLFIGDDPPGTFGTNTGTFQLQITDVSDGYQIEGLDTIDLTVNTNPYPPVREISLDDLIEITVPEGDSILVPISRIATRNGLDDLGHSVTVGWQISTISEKFTTTSGSFTIPAGETNAVIEIPTGFDFSAADTETHTGVFSIISASSSLYSDYVIPTKTVDITLQDVVKTIEISNQPESTIEILEGDGTIIELLATYTIDGVAQQNIGAALLLSFSNVDDRLFLPELGVSISGETLEIPISTNTTTGLQNSVDTIFKIESVSDNYFIKPPVSKIINVVDNAVVVRQLFIDSQNIVTEEGNDVIIIIKRISTADGIDNYSDGGVSVPWRLIGNDTRYGITSGVLIFENGETQKTLTITTSDNNVGSADITSIFEIYEPTNNYTIVENANTITITLTDNDPLYTVTETANFINEGSQISFNINTTRVPDNTTVYAYINSETVTPSDFISNAYKRNTVDYAGTSSSITSEITYNPQNSTPNNAIASKGDLLVVGDCYASPAGVTAISGYTAGQVKVYRNISGTWTLEQTIVSPNSESGYFGWDVGVDGDRIIIGEYAWRFVHPTNPALNENANGSAYVYKYNSTTGVWGLEQSLPTGRTAFDPGPTREGALFGYSVAIENNFVVVGAPYDFQQYAGRIYVYSLDAGTWSEFDVVTGGYNNTFGDRIGYNVKLHNKIIISGDVLRSDSFITTGEVSSYLIGETALSSVSGITASPLNQGDNYGYDVAIYNNWSAVIWFDPSGIQSATSRLQIYNLVDGAWSETQVIDYDERIYHVEIFEDYMFVVSQTKDIIYENQSSGWTEIHSETTTQSGSLNRGRRQSQINNTTKQIMKLDGASVKLYEPQYSNASINIVGNSATFTLTTLEDTATETGEVFSLELWSDAAPNGSLLASSGIVTISDSVYEIITDKNSYDESETITVTVQADLSNGTQVPFTITGVSEADISSITGASIVSITGAGTSGYSGVLEFSKSSGDPQQAVITGSTQWTVPDGVNSISILCVGQGGRGGRNSGNVRYYAGGGGGLAYINDVSVTPGEILDIDFTGDSNRNNSAKVLRDGTMLCGATGGGRASPLYGSAGNGQVGTTRAGASASYIAPPPGPYGASGYTGQNVVGGGAAAGYTGNGNTSGQPQSGTNGYYDNPTTNHGGGGIGILGTSVGTGGFGFASGAYGGGDGGSLNGGSFGGGGALYLRENPSTSGFPDGFSYGVSGSAVVRIMWGGGRSYPTNAEDFQGPPETIASAQFTITLSEDLSILEGDETLVLNVDNTTAKTLTINDTSVTKEYSLDAAFETINKTETDSGVTSTTVTMNRTYTVGTLAVPITWSGTDSRFSNNTNATVTFADGSSTATFNVFHSNDTAFSGDASGTYTLETVTGWTRAAPYILTYNLTENDPGEQTITMQIPADADYWTVANGENLLTTCTNMTLSGSSYKLYKINQDGSVTLLDSLSVSHPNTITRTLRRGIFSGGQYYGSYETLSSWTGTRSLTKSIGYHVVGNNSYGSLGLFYSLDNGGEMLATTAGVQILDLGTSTPSLLYRFGSSFYIGLVAGRVYVNRTPVGFTPGISGINENSGRYGANWPNGGNGAMYFTASTAFSVSSDGYQNTYYQDTPAQRAGSDTGKTYTDTHSTSFIWSPDAAIEQ